MPFRTWMYVFAIIGLTGPALGQTEEEAQAEQGQTAEQQQPASDLPLPFPVEIIENQATTDARQNREEESRQNEIADLVAQEGMNAATQAIKDATLDMRDSAQDSTILVGIGTLLLVITLVLTAQANRAAVRSVKLTENFASNQLRPWVTPTGIDHFFASNFTTETESFKEGILFATVWRNSGATPATSCYFFNAIRVIGADEDVPYFEAPEVIGSGVVGPGEISLGSHKPIGDENFQAFIDGKSHVVLYGLVRYADALGGQTRRESQSCHRISCNGRQVHKSGEEKPNVISSICGPQNTAT